MCGQCTETELRQTRFLFSRTMPTQLALPLAQSWAEARAAPGIPSITSRMACKNALATYASRHGLTYRATAFAGLSYCDQVRLAASARVLVGVHGQGMTNGMFMGDDGLVVELFHPHWRSFDNVGHQPLYHGAGRPYVAAPYAHSRCPMMAWKHNPTCTSTVNATRLVELVRWAHGHIRPAA